jgi:hypothetical protein
MTFFYGMLVGAAIVMAAWVYVSMAPKSKGRKK